MYKFFKRGGCVDLSITAFLVFISGFTVIVALYRTLLDFKVDPSLVIAKIFRVFYSCFQNIIESDVCPVFRFNLSVSSLGAWFSCVVLIVLLVRRFKTRR